jgi:hypothetical protein
MRHNHPPSMAPELLSRFGLRRQKRQEPSRALPGPDRDCRYIYYIDAAISQEYPYPALKEAIPLWNAF